MKRTGTFITAITFFALAALTAGCSSASTNSTKSSPAANEKTVISGIAGNNMTASISNQDGIMHKGKHDFTLTFYEPSGKTVDVGTVATNFRMPAMGSMSEMNAGATFTTTSTPGAFKGNADLSMLGEWEAQITYEGKAGKGSFTLPIVVKP